MDIALTHLINGFKYEVVYDTDGNIDLDFENEAQKREYESKWFRGDINAYGVIKYERCTCCEQWKQIESIWNIHAESASEAFQYYNEEYKA